MLQMILQKMKMMVYKTIEMTERYAKLAPNQGQVQVKALYL
jgi:hypothetical protein